MRSKPNADFDDVVLKCFATDPAFVDKYHIAAGSGLAGCADRTIGDLKKMHSSFEFFEIYDGDKLAGFIGTEDLPEMQILSTFFMMPEYRTRKGMSDFWRHIRANHFNNGPFFSGIYEKNSRAVKFFLYKGGQEVARVKHEGTYGLVFFFESET